MTVTLGFDVYGTLIDTAGVTEALTAFAGDRAPAFSTLWREKQLEYSFRRALMQNYVDFRHCTRSALDYACAAFKLSISASDKQELMAGYRVLPAFPDVESSLPILQEQGFNMFAFSNGRPEDVSGLLENSGIRSYFVDVISTHEIESFKPNPAAYAHFLARAGAAAAEAWLISGNPFDVIGAISAGMNGAWVKRSEQALFDPWEIEPTVVIASIAELAEAIDRR